MGVRERAEPELELPVEVGEADGARAARERARRQVSREGAAEREHCLELRIPSPKQAMGLDGLEKPEQSLEEPRAKGVAI